MAQKKLKEPLNIKTTSSLSNSTATSSTITSSSSSSSSSSSPSTVVSSSSTSTATTSASNKPLIAAVVTNGKSMKSGSPIPGQKGQAPPPPVSVTSTVASTVVMTTMAPMSYGPIYSEPITECVSSNCESPKATAEPVASSIPVVTAGSVFSSPSSNKTVVSSQTKPAVTTSCLPSNGGIGMATSRSSSSPSPTSILSTSLTPSPRVTATTRVVFSGVSPLPKGGAVPNPATSTPVNSKQHVTFSSHVTEIAEDGVKEQSKKIPPPPPPRRSSRPGGFSSPQTGRRSSSPPAYENIENFVKGETRESRSMMNGAGYHQRSRSEPAKHTAGARVQLPPTAADVAALYAVPSTCRAAQQAKTNSLYPEEVATNGRHSDSDSTTSSVDSQTVTLRPDAMTNGKVKMRDGKKIPPPPPVRRTSTLSTQSSNQSQNSNSSNEENDKRKSVAELQQHFILEAGKEGESPVLVNGGTKAPGPATVNNGESSSVQTIVTKIQNTTKPATAANGTIPQQKGQPVPNKNYAETEIF